MAAADVHAAAHITGGGLAGNLPRALPEGMRAVVDRATWEVPRIFSEIRRLGEVTDPEMARVFNLGIGMVVVVGSGSVPGARAALRGAGVEGVVIGQVVAGAPGVELTGTARWSGVAPAAEPPA
jgi:phosphoribosylformylglycinamidine cyclo-ligase